MVDAQLSYGVGKGLPTDDGGEGAAGFSMATEMSASGDTSANLIYMYTAACIYIALSASDLGVKGRSNQYPSLQVSDPT